MTIQLSTASSWRLVLALVAVGTVVAGCQAPQRTRPSAAASTACRAEVDRVYAAQNRVELSQRDQRDTPFAGGYNSGITSRGLSSEYGRENQLSSCLNNSTAPGTPPAAGATATPGPVFTPAAR